MVIEEFSTVPRERDLPYDDAITLQPKKQNGSVGHVCCLVRLYFPRSPPLATLKYRVHKKMRHYLMTGIAVGQRRPSS